MSAHSQKTRIRKSRLGLAEDGWAQSTLEPTYAGDSADIAAGLPSSPGHALAAMQILPRLNDQTEVTGAAPGYESVQSPAAIEQQRGGLAAQRAQEDDPHARTLRGDTGVEQPEPTVGSAGGPLGPATTARIEAARGTGSALDGATRGSMEGAFGTSFADVRVHTDSEADALNRGVSAVAFTTGSDIFFRQGAFQPGSSEGRQLLGHELTHVVQQRGMSGSGPLTVGPAGDSHEQRADATAAAVAAATTAPAGAPVLQPSRSNVVRRDEDPQQGQGDGQQSQGDGQQGQGDYQQGQGDGGLQDVSGEQDVDMPVPDPITLPIEDGSGPGDYPAPANPNVMMAKHVGVPFLQRDDTPPQGSSGGGDDGGQPSNQATAQSGVTLAGPKQAPYQIQVTRTFT